MMYLKQFLAHSKHLALLFLWGSTRVPPLSHKEIETQGNEVSLPQILAVMTSVCLQRLSIILFLPTLRVYDPTSQIIIDRIGWETDSKDWPYSCGIAAAAAAASHVWLWVTP